MSRTRFRFSVLGLLLLMLASVALVRPTSALTATIMLADTNTDFVNGGSFLRTSLGNPSVGGVQLLNATIVRPWVNNPFPLPEPLMNDAAVGFHNQIFVVGGQTLDTAQTPAALSAPVQAFFFSQLADPTTGALAAWTQHAAPPVGLSQTTAVVAETSSGAYLYAIGGMIAGAGNVVSTDQIYYNHLTGPDANGLYTPGAWHAIGGGATLPFPAGTFGGGAAELGATVQMVGGLPNIFIFGGHSRTRPGPGAFVDLFFDTVWRAPINNDGTLQPWIAAGHISNVVNNVTTRIGDDNGVVGLAGTNAITYTQPETGKTGVYLLGGHNNNSTTDSNAYTALLDAGGTLTWQPAAGLTVPLVYHSSVQSNGALFAIGGTANPDQNQGQPQNNIEAGILDLTTLNIEGAGGQLASFSQLKGALDKYRQSQASATIDAGVNGRWVYIVGGQSSATLNGTPTLATPDVVVGRFGYGGDQIRPTYVDSGNYYSQPYDFASAKFQQLSWKTSLQAGTSITLGYRAANDLTTLSALPYTNLTGGSVNGFNGPVDLPPAISGTSYRYFQFVARLATSDTTKSPLLDWVQLKMDRAGYPNLKATAIGLPTSFVEGSLTAPGITLMNKDFSLSVPAVDASFGDPNGGFYVDMYITPGSTAAPPVFGQSGQVYATVLKSNLPASNTNTYTIPAGNWYLASSGLKMTDADWNALFPHGTYTVYVMADSYSCPAGTTDPLCSYGYVQEAAAPGTGGETDNVGGPLHVTVGPRPTTRSGVLLPYIRR